MRSYKIETPQRIQNALQIIDASKIVEIGRVISGRTAEIFRRCFGDRQAIIVVVTAGSVDGYSAYGASISENGFKKTFFIRHLRR